MKTLTTIVFATILSVTFAFADEASSKVVTYKEYLAQVLAYYPLLKKEHASIEKSIASKALAASSKMPQFWASVKSEYGDDPVYVFGALLRQNRFTNDSFALGRLNTPSPVIDHAAGVGGQWLLFDFAQTSSKIKAAGLMTESAQFQSQATQMEAILAASEVYSRLAVTDALLKVINVGVNGTSKDIAMAESLAKKGLALGADFYLARMTKTQLLQTRNEVKAQRAALAMVFNVLRGQDPALPVDVETTFKKVLPIEGTAEEWISKSVSNRLDVKAMEKALEAQGYDVKTQKSSFMPKIMAYGNADENVNRIGNSGGGNYVVGVKAKMDLFDPSYASRVKVAREDANQLSASLQATKDQAAKDTAETFYRLQALKSNTQLAFSNRDDALTATQLMMPLYKEGRRSIEQMVAVRAALVQAQERWLRMDALRRQSTLILKYYAGELTPSEAEGIYGQ